MTPKDYLELLIGLTAGLLLGYHIGWFQGYAAAWKIHRSCIENIKQEVKDALYY